MTTDSVPATQPQPRRVIVVDDEPDMLNMLKLVLSKQCACEVILASSGSAALELMAQAVPEVVVTDIKMPDVDGLVLLKKIQELDSTVSVVIMTGYGTIDMAVQSIKDGAYDFLEKPFDKDLIVRVVNNCLERTSLLRANRRLQQQLDTIALPQGFVGQSPALKRVLDLIGRVADTDATVLIRGESGTGKEVAARALHKLSGRRERAMVTVNCPALPEQILESELFGYSRGAFTGAMQEKKGLFLEAHQSTILLDEIADIPVSVQTKLLRVLQEKEIQPLGQNRTIKIDVRVVASTNQDLEAKIRAGEFREDLFYRLNVVTIVMPSLEEMREDVPLLVHYFLSHYKKHYHREELVVSPDVLQYLFQRKWPGNVRELQNTVKRLVLLADSGGGNITDLCAAEPDCVDLAVGDPYVGLYSLHYNEAKNRVVDDFSMEYLNNLLHRHNGNVTNAASDSGMERQALQRLMRRYSILSANFKKPE